MASALSCSLVANKLISAGKRLLLPPSSSSELLNVLAQLEQLLSKATQLPSESIMNPIIKALIAKQLVRHPDMDVNISVACCICEIMRIMTPKNPYNDEQLKDFFEMVVRTLEKLSSACGGCYTKMTKVLENFSNIRLSVLMLHLEQDGIGLVVRLFKQFLTVADSNSSAIVLEMEKIMTIIIEESEELAHELVGLLVASLKKDKEIASPVCWQLGEKVLMNIATQLNPHLPVMGRDMSIALYDYSKMVACICKTASEKDIMEVKEDYSSFGEIIRSTTDTSKLRNDTTHKRKLEYLEGIRNMVQTVRRCQHGTMGTVNTLGIHPKDAEKHENKPISFDDPSMTSKFVSEVKGKRKRNNSPWKKEAQSVEHGENLVGRRIKVWWCGDKMYYEGVVKFFDFTKKKHKVLYDDGDEELLDLKLERWKLLENVSAIQNSEAKDIIPHTPDVCKSRKDNTHKLKPECEETANVCQQEKKILSIDDPPMLPESITLVKSNHKRNHTPSKKVLGHAHPTKVSSPQGGITFVQGYKVKQSVAPILEAIFKKHGDIAAQCLFQSASVRSSFLEVVCEVVGLIQTNDSIEKMEEIECQVSDTEAANIDVSWIRAHLKAFYKRQEATKKSSLLMEMKANTILVKRAAETDLREICVKLLSAKEQFEKAEKCVRVLHLVERNLNNNILESKADLDLWVKQPIL